MLCIYDDHPISLDLCLYDKGYIETYLLEKITDIFDEAIRKSCIIHDTNKEGVENFLRNNWDELRFDELVGLILSYVYDHSFYAFLW